jgi:hypothetical protein
MENGSVGAGSKLLVMDVLCAVFAQAAPGSEVSSELDMAGSFRPGRATPAVCGEDGLGPTHWPREVPFM